MASDVKPYVVFIQPPPYDRIVQLRRGKVDPFNPKPDAQMNVSVIWRKSVLSAKVHIFAK